MYFQMRRLSMQEMLLSVTVLADNMNQSGTVRHAGNEHLVTPAIALITPPSIVTVVIR
jgi:hypothetical protein